MSPTFKFKGFQLEDYARAAMHDGAILGHDTGGGKGLALYIWPSLKTGFQREGKGLRPLGSILIVAPGDLHKQVMDEGREKFGAKTTVLDSQETFLRLAVTNPVTGRYELPPGFYITSYTQLGTNGVAEFPKLGLMMGNQKLLDAAMRQLDLAEYHIEEYFNQRAVHCAKQYQRLNEYSPCGPDSTLGELQDACAAARRCAPDLREEFNAALEVLTHFHRPNAKPSFAALPAASVQFIQWQFLVNRYLGCQANIGWTKYVGTTDIEDEPAPGALADIFTIVAPVPFKCVWSPTLADLCQDTFAAVTVDEGVKMKGDDTHIALGVRQMKPRYRLVLTATPIKNRLPDVFWLAHWAAGGHAEASARWPYPDATAAREEFAGEFLISERNLSMEKETNRRYKKQTPQICNVHRLWKLIAPVVLRRRKKDFGEDIVPKHRHMVRVPMGTHQADVYQHHLLAEYKDGKGRKCVGPQLQALRVAAANPASVLLEDHYNPANAKFPSRSRHTYTPKLHAALKIIQQVLARGEQVVVFSAFHDSLDTLSARLNFAGVSHCKLDGRTSQKKRGVLAGQFKLGPGKSPFPVMLAGVECMAEGHSFNLCNNVILMCYSWAYDKFEQAINRVHRLNSPWPVNVFPIICEGSIDRKLEALITEKGDAAELVLDGHLLGEHSSEMNLAELLNIAREEFTTANTVDEAVLEKQWPALQQELVAIAKVWRGLSAARLTQSHAETLTPEVEIPAPAALTIPPLPEPTMRNNQPPYNANPGMNSEKPQPAWRRRLCKSAATPDARPQNPNPKSTIPQWRLNLMRK